MVDKDRVKGPVHHPESTVEEGVGTLKEDAKKTSKATGKAESSAGGAKGTPKQG